MLADQSQRHFAISLIVMSGVTLPLSLPSPPQFEDPVCGGMGCEEERGAASPKWTSYDAMQSL
jgi:hypothetical protein